MEDLCEYVPAAHMRNFRHGFHKRVIHCRWPQTRAQANAVIETLQTARPTHNVRARKAVAGRGSISGYTGH
jgi:hypothetical protein